MTFQGIRIAAEVNSDGVTDLLRHLEYPVKSLEQIKEYQRQRIADSFTQKISPRTGKAWKPLVGVKKGKKSGSNLAEQEQAIGQSLYAEIVDGEVEIGYSHPLAEFYQYGSRIQGNQPLKPKRKVGAGAASSQSKPRRPAQVRMLVGWNEGDFEQWQEILLADAVAVWNG